MKSEQINSYLEVKQRTERDVRQLGVLVSESYEADSTDGQTVINLNFTVDVNNKKQIWLFVDGMKLVEGITANYTFTNIVGSLSSQITLNSPLTANLPIQAYKIGAYQETLPNPSSVTATLLNDVAQPHKMAQDAFQPFVKKEFITAPNTTIVNRAKVESASLKAIAGVERVMTKGITALLNEFGVNGEPVYEAVNKDSRIRFVGNWFKADNAYGNYIHTNTVGDYVEVTFYGNGLNLLIIANNPDSWLISIDGGAETALVLPSLSAVISQRNYSPNQAINVASGLSLGWHTVRIKNNNATFGMPTHGFEILNYRTDIAVLSGTAYYAMKQEVLASLNTSSFKAGVVGTRGARVVKYLKDGIISQVVTEVDASAAYLTSADHSNEEVFRKINFREFGANRSDDFSTMTGTASSRAFTLDDGTTTLTCVNYLLNNGPSAVDGIVSQGNTAIIITFVGTGLDIIRTDNQNGTNQNNAVAIDGTTVGNLNTLSAVLQRREKICSGLPYGTHTVRITSAATYSFGVSDFIIYQPKKPVLPMGAVELADYCVLSDYSINTIEHPTAVSTGVIRKMNIRELLYVGTWASSLDSANLPSGHNTNSTTVGSYVEYTFFGTGFDYRVNSEANQTQTLTLDGSTNFSGLTTQFQATGATWTPASGTITGNAGPSGVLSVKNLPLGKHTIRVTLTASTGGGAYPECFDIHTPIHFNNTKIGSLSLKDSRAFSPVIDRPEKLDMTKAKAWIVYNQVTGKILNSFGISAIFFISAGRVIIYFEKRFKGSYAVTYQGDQAQAYYESYLPKPDSIQVTTTNTTGGVGSATHASLIFFGELDDEQEF